MSIWRYHLNLRKLNFQVFDKIFCLVEFWRVSQEYLHIVRSHFVINNGLILNSAVLVLRKIFVVVRRTLVPRGTFEISRRFIRFTHVHIFGRSTRNRGWDGRGWNRGPCGFRCRGFYGYQWRDFGESWNGLVGGTISEINGFGAVF